MESVVRTLNNRYLIAIVVGLFVWSFARGVVRR